MPANYYFTVNQPRKPFLFCNMMFSYPGSRSVGALVATILVPFIVFLGAFSNANAQRFTTKGTDFWLGFPETVVQGGVGPNLVVYISSDDATSGVVEMPLTGFSQAFTLGANDTATVEVPYQQAMASGTNTIAGRGIHVTAQDSINVFAMSLREFATDASIVLPTETLRDEYRIFTYYEDNPGVVQPGGAEFIIVAVEDNTTIEITPTQDIGGGPAAGTTATITLDAGEVYQGQAAGDLSGTVIRGVGPPCRPFAVFAGHRCTSISIPSCTIGANRCCCDHIFEQMYPLNTWGTEYITLPYIQRQGDLVKILAAEDNTNVTVPGQGNFTLNAGESTSFITNDRRYISADQPIAVGQFSLSQSCDGSDADPYMVMLSPTEQMTVTEATVNALDLDPPNQNTWTHYINIVTTSEDTALFTINGQKPAIPFSPIAGNPDYSGTFEVLPDAGNYILESDSGFVAYIYGFSTFDSYGYMAGFALDNVNLRVNVDPEGVVCVGDTVNFEGVALQPIQSWRWDFQDGDTAVGQTSQNAFPAAGTYFVKLEAQGSGTCGINGLDSAFAEVTVVGPTADSLLTDVSCFGGNDGSIELTGQDGIAPYSFQLNGNQQSGASATFSGLAAGIYGVELSDNSGCNQTLLFSIEEPEELTASITDQANPTCNGATDGFVVVEVEGGTPPYSYNLPAQDSLVPNLAAGDYDLEVTDANGCTVSLPTLTLAEPDPITANLQTTDVTCENPTAGSISVQASGGDGNYTYALNGSTPQASPDFTGLTTGTYSITVTDGNGCTEDFSTDIVHPTELNLVLENQTDVSCAGDGDGSVELSATGVNPPFAFGLSQNGPFQPGGSLSGLNAGPVTVWVEDATGCLTNLTLSIAEPAPLNLSATANPASCDTLGSAVLSANGGTPPYRYGTSLANLGPSGVISGLPSGTRTLFVQDDNGCRDSATVSIAGPDYPELGPADTVCRSANYQPPNPSIGGGSWSSPGGLNVNPTNGTTNLEDFAGNDFRLVYTLPTGCADTLNVHLLPRPQAAFSFSPEEPNLPDNATVNFTSESQGAQQLQWTFHDSTTQNGPSASYTYGFPGTYGVELLVINEVGCSNRTTASVLVSEDIKLLIPSAFSPNNDNLNELWQVTAVNMERFRVLIFNRWGEKILDKQGTDPNDFNWDGTYQSQPVPEGVYTYRVEVSFRNGQTRERAGTITVIR